MVPTCFNSSKRMSLFLSTLTLDEISNWKGSISSLWKLFNSNFKREKLIRFLLKGLINILPTGTNLKSWKLLEDSGCIKCNEEETIVHILEAQCTRNVLEFEIVKAIKKLHLPKSYILKNEIKLRDMISMKWNFKHALGVVDEEIVCELRTAEVDCKQINALGKFFLKIGYHLWEKRCALRMSLMNTVQDIPNSLP